MGWMSQPRLVGSSMDERSPILGWWDVWRPERPGDPSDHCWPRGGQSQAPCFSGGASSSDSGDLAVALGADTSDGLGGATAAPGGEGFEICWSGLTADGNYEQRPMK